MGRGFLAGIFWGGVVGLVLLAVSSQTLERQQLSFPQPKASPVEVPGGTEFDQARDDSDPVVPLPETRPEAETASGVTAPADAVDTPPAFDTSALEVPTPTVQSPGGLGAMPETPNDAPEPPAISDSTQPSTDGAALAVPEAPGGAPDTETAAPETVETPDVGEQAAPEIESGGEAPVETEVAALPQIDSEAPAGSDGGGAPQVSTVDTSPTAPVAPGGGDEPSLPIATEQPVAPSLPQVTNEPSLPSASPSAPAVVEAPAAPSSGAGRVTVDGSGESFFKPVDSLGDQAADVGTDRLPQIGTGSADQTPDVEDAPDTSAPAAAATIPEGPALLTFRSDFDNPEGNPLMSVVLIQSGPALSQAQLDGLPQHVAFAVDAADDRAEQTAAHYRAAGREVVLIPSLPQGARPQDVEQALRVNFETVPQAVAVMDISGGRFQSDRAASSQVVDVVSDTGHGLITFPRGLNTVHQRADQAGVPTGLIFRKLDGGDETSEQIRRTLDRAAFRARQEDAVILVGTTSELTLAAIVEWSMGNRSSSVTIAPISAALLED